MAGYMQHHQDWVKVMNKYPILKRLHKEQVFSIGVMDEGGETFDIAEECDVYFSQALSKDEMKQRILRAKVTRSIIILLKLSKH